MDGLKFDLRIYVMVFGVDPLRIFLYKDGLTRLATEPYCGVNNNNLEDVCMHLTNYAVNKYSENFI
jgi:tubulin polyglutamylase TTLL6/13